MVKEIGNEIGAAVGRTSPALAVAAASVSGWGVQEWMYLATTVYVIAQLGYLAWKWFREWRSGKVPPA